MLLFAGIVLPGLWTLMSPSLPLLPSPPPLDEMVMMTTWPRFPAIKKCQVVTVVEQRNLKAHASTYLRIIKVEGLPEHCFPPVPTLDRLIWWLDGQPSFPPEIG